MASISQIQDGPSAGRAHKSASPVSAHPAFPLVVALWFAALLGLGSLVLPVALLENLVSITGIADLVPAAEPPLGVTARIAIALLGSVIGAALGWCAARRIARPAPEQQPRRRSFKSDEHPRRQPLSAREELGSDSFDSVAGFASARRRALAAEEKEGKSDLFQTAPLPDQAPGHGFAYAEQAPQPLDLEECAEFTELQQPQLHNDPVEEAIAMTEKQVFSLVPNKPVAADPLPFSPPSMARNAPQETAEMIDHAVFETEFEAASRQEFMIVPAPETVEAASLPVVEVTAGPVEEAGPVEDALPDDEPGLVDLVHKLGSTLEKHREWNAQRKASMLEASKIEAPHFPRAVPEPVFAGPPFAAPAFAAPAFAEREFDMAAPAEAAQAMAAFFAPEPSAADLLEIEIAAATAAETLVGRPELAPAPAAAVARQLRPFAGLTQLDDGDDDELDQLAASFSLPIKRAAPARPEPVAAQLPDKAPEQPEDETYSSLREMKNPFRENRSEFVRIDEPDTGAENAMPAVVFPHEEPAATAARAFDRPGPVGVPAAAASDSAFVRPSAQRPSISSDDNDRVLREALMNLQRIGKI